MVFVFIQIVEFNSQSFPLFPSLEEGAGVGFYMQLMVASAVAMEVAMVATHFRIVTTTFLFNFFILFIF